ncbi:aldo/keto reductase [Oceanibacterium hippocampi]|uniref:L-glyceraldehyde 3-phosphate reductase n=1 Tax=Oceanibacterium hippocampi TaxID=745714 RepID=A0A1Y5TXN7_9PROT|nr:aldo/keto reductase [Oceanibacterium hippocampi]SLN73186.1 L-glyceraldehyde 3-phosphate reductase [Oceanibacterium hippocampi]
MDYVRFGRTGMKVSRLCLGAMTYGTPEWRDWVLDEERSRPFLKQAFELGINFIDSSNIYSLGRSEEIVGRAIRDFSRREDVVLATKVGLPMGKGPNQSGLSRKHILHSIDKSLARLGTDHVDLYIIHRWDYGTPIEETLEALNDVVRSGKARYIGASSGYAWQMAEAIGISRRNGWAEFVSMQNLYNLLYREEEREMLPYCAHENIAVTPWSPLARGFLAGTMPKGADGATTRARTTDKLAAAMVGSDTDYDILAAVQGVAKKRGVSPARIACAWLYGKPVVTSTIIGASKPGHLEDAVAAFDIVLEADEIAALEAPYRPRAVVGHQ